MTGNRERVARACFVTGALLTGGVGRVVQRVRSCRVEYRLVERPAE
jgi:hypothetical protein